EWRHAQANRRYGPGGSRAVLRHQGVPGAPRRGQAELAYRRESAEGIRVPAHVVTRAMKKAHPPLGAGLDGPSEGGLRLAFGLRAPHHRWALLITLVWRSLTVRSKETGDGPL